MFWLANSVCIIHKDRRRVSYAVLQPCAGNRIVLARWRSAVQAVHYDRPRLFICSVLTTTNLAKPNLRPDPPRSSFAWPLSCTAFRQASSSSAVTNCLDFAHVLFITVDAHGWGILPSRSDTRQRLLILARRHHFLTAVRERRRFQASPAIREMSFFQGVTDQAQDPLAIWRAKSFFPCRAVPSVAN